LRISELVIESEPENISIIQRTVSCSSALNRLMYRLRIHDINALLCFLINVHIRFIGFKLLSLVYDKVSHLCIQNKILIDFVDAFTDISNLSICFVLAGTEFFCFSFNAFGQKLHFTFCDELLILTNIMTHFPERPHNGDALLDCDFAFIMGIAKGINAKIVANR